VKYGKTSPDELNYFHVQLKVNMKKYDCGKAADRLRQVTTYGTVSDNCCSPCGLVLGETLQ